MEKGQLDFSAPLMSARRYSSPSKSSELVKPKVVHKPLPCRQQSLQHNKSDWESELTKPAAVPFQWEQTPGRPKHTPEDSNTPRLPPRRLFRERSSNIYRPQKDAFTSTDHASLLEKLHDSLSCGDDSYTESGDEAYLDALDALSQTESCSFDCSVSGISGFQSSGVKPSGTFCINIQTRDFMMNRFLPSAKAAVRGTLEYAVKKPSMLKKVKKAVSGEMKPPLRQCGPDALPCYAESVSNVESEDENQESSAPKKKSGKTWGFLLRFCVKNSLFLLNPLPALKLKTKSRAPSPSTREVSGMTRNAHSGPLAKNACQVVHKKKFHSGQFLKSMDSHGSAGVSPLSHYRSGNIFPYRNESPKSPFREGVGFLGLHKEVEAFNPKIASSHKMLKALQDVSRNQIKAPNEDYVKKKDLSSTKPFRMKAEEVVDALKAKTLEEGPADVMDGGKLIQSINQEAKNEVDCEEESENGRGLYHLMEPPLSPPLPKSPSEPWLWRTSSLLHQKMQGQKVSAANTKWETIVKTCNLRQNHIYYSEELQRATYRRMKS